MVHITANPTTASVLYSVSLSPSVERSRAHREEASINHGVDDDDRADHRVCGAAQRKGRGGSKSDGEQPQLSLS